ncbi:MAG: Tat pathway signal protein [Pseudomonadales bacterium]|nr:Tat pathway signal protein [Pseudomonadales bacterium]
MPVVSRRVLLKGGLGASLLGILGCEASGNLITSNKPLLGFTSVPVQTDPHFDQVVVAPGYQARPFFSWGDPVLANAPPWQSDGSNSWQDQLRQAGQNHDGMHFFPFADAPNEHGLLVVNHEYVNPTLHPSGFSWAEGQRPLDEVRKEQAAHGLSIIEIRKDTHGDWQMVPASSFNRRLTAHTPMAVSGPLSGHALMRTEADPNGTEILGTLNNCSMGVTPWGTYLMCEENWHNYFYNADAKDHQARPAHWRNGVPTVGRKTYQGWETVDPRFDATPHPERPNSGYVNEPNRFGWVVEVDPFDPKSTPVKRTALGRFCRECATVSLGDNGVMAVYSGDDARGEYIYKFVPARAYVADRKEHNPDLLDQGTLYVARLDEDGTGEWKALVWGQNGLTAENGFSDQAFVLVNTRLAADQVGATPMDRPEWVAIHPENRDVYVSLTNNRDRGSKQPLHPANPRAHNLHGQILKLQEQDGNPGATTFRWELFLLAGEADSEQQNLTGNINGDVFSSPDGLAFDGDGRLWIETDYDDDEPHNAAMGCNQLLCADPISREVRRFLVGPRGCEITGITFTPDQRSMWINIQHPGISYPASDGTTRPRSTTVLITKDDGGVIGT